MAEHLVVKPEKILATAQGLLQDELIVPRLFHREGFDQFVGADNDTVNVIVPGVLPFREYAWRNDRSSGIVFDDYAERKVPVTFGGNIYSAVRVTDEQFAMDIAGWAKLLAPQTRAVGRGLQRKATDTLTGASYNVTIGNAGANLRGAIIEARRVLNAFNVPDEQRFIVCGTDFEAALLNEDKFVDAQHIGETEAVTALRNATITSKFGFTFIVDQTVPADEAYAILPSGYIFVSGAPKVPAGAYAGSTGSYEGIALRHILDYDTEYQRDRSVVNTYYGFRTVKDVLVGVDGSNQEFVSTSEYFVRGVKLTLDGSSDYPAAASELATITGISDAKVWTPTGMGAETDVTDPGPNNA